MKNVIRAVSTAGITIAIVFVSAVFVFANSHYHTGQREGAWGALAASSWLDLLWVVVAGGIALTRWRLTTRMFRIILLFNSLIAALLLYQIISAS